MRVQAAGMRLQSGQASVLAEQTALSGPSDGLYPPRAHRSRRFPRPCPKRMLLLQTCSTSHGLGALAAWGARGRVELLQRLQCARHSFPRRDLGKLTAEGAQENRDVVVSTALLGKLDERVARRVEPRRTQDSVSDLGGTELVRQPVRAEKEAIALAQFDPSEGDLHVGFLSHGLKDDVLEGGGGRVLGCERAPVD